MRPPRKRGRWRLIESIYMYPTCRLERRRWFRWRYVMASNDRAFLLRLVPLYTPIVMCAAGEKEGK